MTHKAIKQRAQEVRFEAYSAKCAAPAQRLLACLPVSQEGWKMTHTQSGLRDLREEYAVEDERGPFASIYWDLNCAYTRVNIFGRRHHNVVTALRAAVPHEISDVTVGWYSPVQFDVLKSHCLLAKRPNHRIEVIYDETAAHVHPNRKYGIADSMGQLVVCELQCQPEGSNLPEVWAHVEYSLSPFTKTKQAMAKTATAEGMLALSSMSHRFATLAIPDYELRQCAQVLSNLATKRGGVDVVLGQLRDELGQKSSDCKVPLRTRLRRRIWA